MKNEKETKQIKDQIKEKLYIEMVHRQLETFINIDNLLRSHLSISNNSPKEEG